MFFHNFNTPIQISNCKLSSLAYYLIGKQEPPLPNDKVKAVNSCVKINMDYRNCGPKVVEYRHFPSLIFYGMTGVP